MHAIVHSADVQDRDGGVLVMATLFGLYQLLLKLYADGGCQGPHFRAGLKRVVSCVEVEIVKRSDTAKGFVALPKRWIVERTFALILSLSKKVRTMPPPRQRLGEPHLQGACLPPSRLHPADAEKAMQSYDMIPDGL